MAKCKRCGKKGLFLKLDSDGLCSSCSTIAAEEKILAETQQHKLESEEREKSRRELEDKIRAEMQQEMEILRKHNCKNAKSPMYDLNSIDGIDAIPIKAFDYNPNDGKQYAFNSIEYVLQRKATEHKRNGRMDLAIACLRKSNQIMPLAKMMYTQDDYMRLVKYLRLDKQFEAADIAEKEILGEKSEVSRKASYQKDNTVESDLSENKIPFPPHTSVIKYNDCDINKSIHNDGMNKQLNIAEKYDIDYVQAVGGCCCPECAKYRLRIYCISGSDTRFPKLPDYFKKYSWHCMLSLYPFSLGVNYMRLPENKSLHEIDELIEYSNRPFVDDRADEEIERYNRILVKNKQDYIDGVNKEQARQEYEKIVISLPDCAPKSQGAYTRMKKSNSANFQKLKENAVSVGIEIKDIDNNEG